ncbi:MAG: diguanylate cyclase [Phycisphaeraceae bacterium]
MLSPVPPSSTQPKQALERPKRSIRRRLLGWTLVAVIVPTLLSMGAFGFIARDTLGKQWEADGRMLAQTVAASLEGRISAGLDRRDGELMSSLSHDRRIAFAVIVDRNNNVKHSSVFDAKAFESYRKGETTWSKMQVSDVGNAQSTMVSEKLVVHTTPVLTNGGSERMARAGPDTALAIEDMEGALVLGIHPLGLGNMLVNFHLAQGAAALIACIVVLPLMSSVMRRWTRPLADLVTVTRRLAEGKPPEPVLVRSMDELGFLSCAFNDMASSLMGSRRQLMEMNESLEQRVKERTSELQEAMTRLDEMASTDALTHLANRRAFNAALTRFNEDARRSNGDMAAILIDLDGFKPVNDTFGHDVGDELLVLTGQVLKRHCRDFDMAARLGGDEFAVLLRRVDKEEALARAQTILDEFTAEATQLLSRYDNGVPVSMSVGVAMRRETRAKGCEALIRFADQALYAAKGAGKSCVRVAEYVEEAEEETVEGA